MNNQGKGNQKKKGKEYDPHRDPTSSEHQMTHKFKLKGCKTCEVTAMQRKQARPKRRKDPDTGKRVDVRPKPENFGDHFTFDTVVNYKEQLDLPAGFDERATGGVALDVGTDNILFDSTATKSTEHTADMLAPPRPSSDR